MPMPEPELTPQEATEMLRMLTPVGGMNPPDPAPMERARLCRRLYDHIRHDHGFMPRWLQNDVNQIVGAAVT
jgi:hypothetical protein